MDEIRQPRGTGFALRDPHPWPALARLVATGESLGYVSLFLPESVGRDGFATLAALAGETDRLLLGTGIVPMTSRSSFATAMGAATVQERSGGRLILGIGTGRARAGALAELETQVRDIRAWLGGDAPGNRRLALEIPGPVPIWISALGPKAIRLAGRVADGVLLNWCSPERVALARGLVAEGAEDAGRDPAAVTVAVYTRGCVADDPADATAGLVAAAGEYTAIPAYARAFSEMGLGTDATEALVRAVCLTGSPGVARDRIEDYRQAGADLPVVYPVPARGADRAASVEATLTALAPAP